MLSERAHLLERVYTDAHSRVHVRLGRLQMIMEVISESQDLQYTCFRGVFGGEMTGEEDWKNKGRVIAGQTCRFGVS